jgi:8-amino-7-oxononanoate synthase
MRSAQDSVRDELASIDAAGLRRSTRVVEPLDGSRARVDGRDVLVLCSNDYLGLARDPRLAAAARGSLETTGAGAGAARLVTGTRPEHARLEDAVVRLTGAAAALTFSSGYAANLAVLGALLGPKDLAVSDEHNHASLIDGLRLCGATKRIVPHRDVAAVRDALRDAARFRRVAIVTEALFSMDGDVAPLADLLAAARAAGAFLVVDDAHGFGVLGANGRGATEDLGAADDVVRVGTFGKAFGAAGAFVAGAREVVDLVLHKGRAFVFSTATPPSIAAAAKEAMRIADAEPERRRRCLALAARLADGLRARGVDVPRVPGPILPFVVGDPRRAVAASERLLAEHAVLVTAIRPPTVPEGTSRLRVSVSSALADEDVDRAAAALAAVLR